MREVDFFREILGLKKPWKVSGVSISLEDKKVGVDLEHRWPAKFACPECRLVLPVYDHAPVRRWRHLDHGGLPITPANNLLAQVRSDEPMISIERGIGARF